MSEAVLYVLRVGTRDVAVAACSAVLRSGAMTDWELDVVFDRGPARVGRWRKLVSILDESHGETYARLWLGDAGIPCEQQVEVPGVGRLDFRLRSRLFLEIDGRQHGDPDQWQADHERDIALAALGARALRVTYRQLLGQWPTVLAAIERAIADEDRRASRQRAARKRRTRAQ